MQTHCDTDYTHCIACIHCDYLALCKTIKVTQLSICQYGTVYKRPENRVHSRNSAIHKIMHCYLDPIVVHFSSLAITLTFEYTVRLV